eukprot:13606801-Alexandrium_andersonii.AAC.1
MCIRDRVKTPGSRARETSNCSCPRPLRPRCRWTVRSASGAGEDHLRGDDRIHDEQTPANADTAQRVRVSGLIVGVIHVCP